MIRPIRFFLLVIISVLSTKNFCYAQFPYVESFRASTAPGITFGGTPSAFLTAGRINPSTGNTIDPEGDGYLRLTENVQNQKGYVYSNAVFPSKFGLRVDFEYYIYGGNGADGISFFLFDATANPFNIGGFGGSLGYAQITSTNPISPGVSKGYLGIGLDEFGNFSQDNEGRQGGIGFKPGSVALRGAGNGADLTPDNYPYLTSVQTFEQKGIRLVGDETQRQPSINSIGYRRVLMELEPVPAGGYNVTVKITKGGVVPETVTIIDNYYYNKPAPTNLRYGFASSTGDQTNYHEVRNVAIEVFDQNALVPPTANNDAMSGCPGTQLSVDVASNDVTTNAGEVINKSSIDLDPIALGIQKTFVVIGKGTYTANNDGTVTFNPLPTFTVGNATVNYTIADNYGITSTQATITATYLTPTAIANAGPDQFLTNPASISANLAGNNAGVGNTGTWSQVSGPNQATFSNVNLPNASANNLVGGTYVFRWTINIPGGCTTTDDVQITVNRAPVAVADNASTTVATDVTINLTTNDTDPDGNNTLDKTSVIIVTPPQHGTLLPYDPVTGNIIYRPNAGYTGSDTFYYTIKDVNGAVSNQALVTINIGTVAVKPIGSNDTDNTLTNVPITIGVKDNDANGATSTIASTSVPANGGSVSINPNGTITYTPLTGFSGRDTFTYKLKSATNVESDPITVFVNVRPVGTADLSNIFTNQTATINVKDNDLSKNGTTVFTASSPANGTVTTDATGNILTYTPNAGFSGKNTFTYTLRTADGLISDPIAVNINVRPIGSADNSVYTLNTPLDITVKTNDLSKDNTTVVLTSQPTNGTATVTSNLVTYTPNTGFSGTNTFTYILRTVDGLDSDPITVTVTPAPVKPTGSPDVANTISNTPVTILVKQNDASQAGTTVVLSAPTIATTNGSVTLNPTGNPVYTPNTGFSGKDTFTYKLRDGVGTESDPITVTVNVKPVGTNDVANTNAAVPVTIPVKTNDDSKIGTTVIVNNPATPNGTYTVTGAGEVLYTPDATFSGKQTFTYILRTSDGLDSDPITAVVNVKPVGSNDNEGYTFNTPLNINVKNNDVSKLNTTVVTTSTPANGTVSVNASGIITYTPNNGFTGTNTFTYILRTADGLDSDPIMVTVTPVAPIPAGSPDIANTVTNAPVTILVKDNDVSKIGTTVIIQGNPSHGTVALNGNGEPVYTPTAGYSGKDTFTYKLRNTDGFESSPITVTVNVKPLGTADSGIYTVNIPLNIDVKNNDLSKNGTSVIINTSPSAGTLAVNASGIVTYTPAPGSVSNDGFTYTLRTADGLNSDPINVTLTAVPLPVRPTGSPDAAVTLAAVPVTIPVKDNDASKTGTTVVIKDNPTSGTVILNPAGVPVYTPNSDFVGKDVFTYILRDNNGQESDPITVTVSVKPVGSPDNATTSVNKPVLIPIQDNDLSKANTSSVINTNPLHGTVVIDPVSGSATYTPSTGYTGTDTFTYRLKTADGVESDPITVTVSVTPVTQAPDLSITIPVDKPVTVNVVVPNGGSIVITSPPKHGTVNIDPNGKPVYTPTPGYSGPDDFSYATVDANNNQSMPGKVNITVIKPAKIGLAKALTSTQRNTDGSFRLTYVFSVVNFGDINMNQLTLTDDLTATFPARTVTITRLSATGSLRVNTGYNGNSIKEVLLPSSTLAAGSRETIELEVTIAAGQQGGTFLNSATARGVSVSDGSTTTDVSTNGFNPDPVTPGDVTPSTPTQAVVLNAPNVTVPATTGSPVTINIPLPPGTTIVITNPPKNGTITIDPVTGQPIYTPNPGYSGPDDFTYIIRDGNGNESQPGTVTIAVTSAAKIGVAKALTSTTKNVDGSFNLNYVFTLVNYGDFAIERVSLTDNLALAFPDATYQILSINTNGNLQVNTNYNGSTVLNMLLPTSTLEAKSKHQVEMQVKVTLEKDRGTFNNFAVAEGFSISNGTLTSDQSTNGFNPDPITAGDVRPSELTPVELIKGSLKIPAGFSPNNDGINDFFVIENAQGQKINLEIFNRWGNRIYRSSDYQNDWAGKSTEGVRVGDDVPSGTYYYVVIIDGADKRVGYITINR